MHTFGAIILAIVGTLLMQFILTGVSSLLLGPMYDSVGLILPLMMIAAFTGFSHYGGLYFALGLVPKANPKATLVLILAMIVVLFIYNISKLAKTGFGPPVILLLINSVAAVVGSLVAKSMATIESKTDSN
jgi:hypothetical protein